MTNRKESENNVPKPFGHNPFESKIKYLRLEKHECQTFANYSSVDNSKTN